MAEDSGKKRLGRGLAALIGDMENDVAVVERSRSSRRVPIELVVANPKNPRKTFAPEDLADLTASVKAKGIVQPIIARPAPGSDHGQFEIIAGERRWRAAQQAGLHEVPILIQDVGDQEALEIAIIENVQRSDLNPLEEARGYDQLIAEFSYSQQDLANVIGKSRSHVANTLRLLNLPASIQTMVVDGLLTAGHARALLTAENAEDLAKQIATRGLSVREAEALAAAPAPTPAPGKSGPAAKDADVLALEKSLSDALGLNVAIAHKANNSGTLTIRYGSLEQLDAVCDRLKN